MSSIGYAIASLFTAKASTPDNQTPSKNDAEQTQYTKFEDQNTNEKVRKEISFLETTPIG